MIGVSASNNGSKWENEGSTSHKSAPALLKQRVPGPNPQIGGLMAETMPQASDKLVKARQ